MNKAYSLKEHTRAIAKVNTAFGNFQAETLRYDMAKYRTELGYKNTWIYGPNRWTIIAIAYPVLFAIMLVVPYLLLSEIVWPLAIIMPPVIMLMYIGMWKDEMQYDRVQKFRSQTQHAHHAIYGKKFLPVGEKPKDSYHHLATVTHELSTICPAYICTAFQEAVDHTQKKDTGTSQDALERAQIIDLLHETVQELFQWKIMSPDEQADILTRLQSFSSKPLMQTQTQSR